MKLGYRYALPEQTTLEYGTDIGTAIEGYGSKVPNCWQVLKGIGTDTGA